MGVKSESDKPTDVKVKPINEVVYKKLASEYALSIIGIFCLFILISKFGEDNKDAVVILILISMPSYIIYYIFSFNKRCKKQLGMTFSQASKIMKNNK